MLETIILTILVGVVIVMAGIGVAKWDKTDIMLKRLKRAGKLEKKDNENYFQGRPIIHRDSLVDGGVYLSQGESEAIVVDSKYPELRHLYKKAQKKAMNESGHIRKDRVLKAVYNTVKEAMPKQDDAAAKKIVDDYKVMKDKKIALDVFLKEGVGVCKHDALACAALLELFKKDGYITGKPSVDRNSDYQNGHAWCRYTNSAGDVFILDVAQHYKGLLKDASKKDKWAYKRPEDF